MAVLSLVERTKPEPNPEVIATLRDLLTRAEAGEVWAISYQLVMPDGYEQSWATTCEHVPGLVVLALETADFLRAALFEDA